MKLFRVTMFVELVGAAESDLQIEKSVQAGDEVAALQEARRLVQSENPDVNATKVWAWSIERAFVKANRVVQSNHSFKADGFAAA